MFIYKKKGKVLLIRLSKVNFAVFDGIEENAAYIRSAPTCLTHYKAGQSSRINEHVTLFPYCQAQPKLKFNFGLRYPASAQPPHRPPPSPVFKAEGRSSVYL